MNSKINTAFQELIDIKSPKIIPHPDNMNKHPKEQIERLAKLIQYQGQRHPIIISKRSGFIVAGHGRWEAMKLLAKTDNWDQIAVDYQDFESEAQEYAFMTSDNAIAEWAELDLSAVNTKMLDLGPDFDVDLLGIKDFVIEPIEKFEPQADEDEVPDVVHPITRRGDIWLLGNHRLMCGDSTMIDDVEKLMNGEKADMVFTDPPFPNNSGIMHEMIENIDVAFANSRIFCNGMSIWFWDNIGFPPFQESVTAKHIWHKTNGWQAGHFETMYVFHNDGKRHEQLVFNCNSVGGNNKREEQGNHPTPKPVELPILIFEKLKFANSVIDLFSVSGSTLIACEKTSRKCYGMELDEKYCDVIINRWQNYTGKKATLESTGQTYEELKAERDE